MTTRKRSTRLAALTLTGGAALTLLTGPAAFAGDADSTGNHSSTDHSQDFTATPGSDPTVADIGGGTANGGASAANAGANRATGNSDDNSDAVTNDEQINIDSAGNESEGEASILPGDATASGNDSATRIQQGVQSSGTGGGLSVFGQHAFVFNFGAALANTGLNEGDAIVTGNADAWGNRSSTDLAQWALVDDTDGALRIVDQDLAVANLGAALAQTGLNLGGEIDTGNASAGGNDSETAARQDAEVTEAPTGPALVDQGGHTANAGGAAANTGLNEATGADSTDDP